MINVNDFKTGVTIAYEGNIFQVLEFQHVKPGKGPAFVRTKLRNLRTGANIENTFSAGIKVEKAVIDKKTMQYLYNSGDSYVFMDVNTYEQVEINANNIQEEIRYLKENLEVNIIFYKNEMLGLDLPEKVELLVTSAEPGVKGNTATSATKEATLETGMTIRVPLFIEENDVIIVSTRDGKYVSRK